ncbi:MAG: FeoB-associated Cys-rich membrane protein [Muribaculaceae bacterium]|nr:FeoB-associated Cys-rich membrane protein [Muribaculaceae bacterium]
MTTSTIIQTIVVLGIVAVALVYVLRRVINTARGKGDCGCGKDCKCKKHQ